MVYTIHPSRLLQYREEGWFATKYDKWVKGDVDTGCSAAVGSDTKFDLPILAGLFLILAVGVVLSFCLVIFEILYVSYEDSVTGEGVSRGYWKCLGRRLGRKGSEVRDEWLGRGTRKYRDTNGGSERPALKVVPSIPSTDARWQFDDGNHTKA